MISWRLRSTREAGASATASSARGRRIVYASTLAYAAVFAAAAATNYYLFLEPRFDLGNMVQAVWSTSQGRFMQVSDPNGVEVSRLAAHVDPFLALLVPVWWAWSSPVALLMVQAVAVASGAFPVYWLARKHLGANGFAVVLALSYLLYPATQFNAYTPIGIHAVSFAVPLLLYAIWFLDADRLIPFGACAILAATTKEEIAAAVAGLGIWYAVRRGQPRVGALICGLGLTISVLNITVVIPHYAPKGFAPFAGRYAEVGGSPSGMLKMAFSDPTSFVHQTMTWHKLLFIVLLLAPFLGLWALEPLLLAGAVPDLVINLLSSKSEQTTIFYQYTAGIIPFVVAASVLGAAKLKQRRFTPPLLLGVFCCFAIISPLVYTGSSLASRSQARVDAARIAVKLVPAGVPVSASQTMGAYFSTRRSLAVFPSLGSAKWVVVGPVASEIDNPRQYRRALRRLKSDPRWTTVSNAAGIAVFHRSP